MLSGVVAVPPSAGGDPGGSATPWTAAALVSRALEHSDLLRAAEAEVRALEAGEASAGAPADPEIEIEGGRRSEREGSRTGAGAHAAARVTMRFTPPGVRAFRRAAAAGDTRAARVALERLRAETATEVLRRALRLAAADREAAALARGAERMAGAFARLAERPAVTPAELVERRTLELAVARARARAAAAAGERADAWLELEELTHLHASEIPDLAFTIPPEVPLPGLAICQEIAAREAFPIRALAAAAERADARAALARRERWPAPAVSPFLARAGGLGEETLAGTALELPLPVFGRTRAEARAAAAAAEAARYRLAHERHVSVHHVEHLHERLAAARRRAAALPLGALAGWEEAAAYADRQFHAGRLALPALLAAHEQTAGAVEESLHAHRDAAEAWLDLELAAGRPGALP